MSKGYWFKQITQYPHDIGIFNFKGKYLITDDIQIKSLVEHSKLHMEPKEIKYHSLFLYIDYFIVKM